MVRLGDICTKQASNIKQSDLTENEGIYPIFGASGFIKNVDFYQQEKPCVAVVKDGAGVGRVIKLPAYSSAIGTMQYIIPNPGIDSSYLAYLLEYLNLSRYYTGATIPHIYFKDYSKEQIILHSEEEQRKITRVLDHVCNLISMRKQQLAKLDELVKARFVEMFGDPIYNDKCFPRESLASLGLLERGRSQHRPRNAPELLGGNYPLIQTGEVADAGLFITAYHNTYSELGLKQSRMWKAGTLCITIAANIAQTAILTFDACFPDSVVGFISGHRIDAIYMHYWFSFFQKILEEQAPQVAQKNINLKTLSELKVIVPPKELLEAFCEFVAQVYGTRQNIWQSLEKLETLKRALMQEYFG